MLIIVEGPDCGGKSTLVKRLRKDHPDRPFMSMLGGRMDPPEASHKRAYDARYFIKENVMLTERFHPISDAVYRQLDVSPRVFPKVEFENFVSFLARSGSRVIYCRPPLSVAMSAGHSAKGDDTPEWSELVMQNMPALFAIYDRLMFDMAWRFGVTVIPYDWTDPGQSAMVEDAICAAWA